MAYIKFCVIAIETSLKDQSVYVSFNKEVDTDTVTYQNLMIAVNNIQNAPLASFDIICSDDLKTVQLKLKNTPVVNQNYILIIQENVKDLEGNTLDKSLFRNIVFTSSVTSDIILGRPSNFEVISEQVFSWEEKGSDIINSYRLQVSTDTAFHNLNVDISIKDRSDITLGSPLDPGQYYYRIRAEQDDQFGTWSETRTFLVQGSNEYNEDISETTGEISGEDIVIENLVETERTDLLIIEQQPINGVTPLSFSFLFDEPLDSSDIKISVIRSDL